MAAQKNRFNHVISDMDRTMREVAIEGWRDHLNLLSGKVKQKTLNAMGNPYGRGSSAAKNLVNAGNVGRRGAKRKFGRGSAPLLPINEQTGRLRMSVRLAGYRRGVYDVHVGAGVRYAKYILHPAGTRKMVGRGMMGWRNVNAAFPIGQIERLHRARNKVIQDAYRKAGRRS